MSLLRYPGGKSKLRLQITLSLREVANRSDHEYREPFFGGGAVGLGLLLSDSPPTQIWINDADPGIAALWTALIRFPDKLKARILNFIPSVDAFDDFKRRLLRVGHLPSDNGDLVALAFEKLAIHRLSFSGLGVMAGGPLGGREQRSAQKIDARWNPDRLCRTIDLLHARFSSMRVRSGGCTNLDFSVLIEDKARPALLYLDPPYVEVGNSLYQYGFDEGDHVRLAELLKRTSHPWVLSYDDHPLVRKLYSWADIEGVEVGYSISRRTRKVELIISPQLNEVFRPNWKAERIDSPSLAF
jgi:DNA adenine methylase